MGGCVLSRLVVISNRVAPVEEGKASAGGLSVAVEEAFTGIGGLWFGWNGKIDNSTPAQVTMHEGKRFARATMPLSRKDYNDFYAGYSNSTLWPLLHYRLNVMSYSRAHAEGYRRVNELFANNLTPLLEPDDLIWVHDYHLFILGRELKRRGLNNRMGFFLHTPFPPPDMLKACTEHEEIVRALLDYDVIGFQTENDARNLLEYVRRMPGDRVRKVLTGAGFPDLHSPRRNGPDRCAHGQFQPGPAIAPVARRKTAHYRGRPAGLFQGAG